MQTCQSFMWCRFLLGAHMHPPIRFLIFQMHETLMWKNIHILLPFHYFNLSLFFSSSNTSFTFSITFSFLMIDYYYYFVMKLMRRVAYARSIERNEKCSKPCVCHILLHKRQKHIILIEKDAERQQWPICSNTELHIAPWNDSFYLFCTHPIQ